MAHLPILGVTVHAKVVCNLYKRILRHLEKTIYLLDEVRYQSVVVRDKFDRCKHITDRQHAKCLVMEAEKELQSQEIDWDVDPTYHQKFPNSPGGVAYDRIIEPPDHVLDYWSEMEKACYPKYFAKRECRKIEYEEFYNRQYNQPSEKSKECD